MYNTYLYIGLSMTKIILLPGDINIAWGSLIKFSTSWQDVFECVNTINVGYFNFKLMLSSLCNYK